MVCIHFSYKKFIWTDQELNLAIDPFQRNRISISMELVTAVLGDHGQRPQEDYGRESFSFYVIRSIEEFLKMDDEIIIFFGLIL